MIQLDLYQILEVAKDATAADIKAAYRKLAKKEHPDHGGDHEVFSRITKAYEILSNPKRRRLYDDTGFAEKQIETRQKAEEIFLSKFGEVLTGAMQRERELSTNLIDETKAKIRDERNRITNNIKLGKKAVKRFKEVKKKIVCKAGNNELEKLINIQIKGMEDSIEDLQDQLTSTKEALKLTKDYKYLADDFDWNGLADSRPTDNLMRALQFKVGLY